MFQFHTGSIKGCQCSRKKVASSCFNSTLVRLREAFGGCQQRQQLLLFQFHTGSIKGWSKGGDFMLIYRFQFHTGSIKGV